MKGLIKIISGTYFWAVAKHGAGLWKEQVAHGGIYLYIIMSGYITRFCVVITANIFMLPRDQPFFSKVLQVSCVNKVVDRFAGAERFYHHYFACPLIIGRGKI